MKVALMAIAGALCAIRGGAQWANTTCYNANGSYGGCLRATTFDNRSTTQHYGVDGASVGSLTTTMFGNQTTTCAMIGVVASWDDTKQHRGMVILGS